MDAAAWALPGCNPQRTSRAGVAGPADPAPRWSLRLGHSATYPSGVGPDGTIYVLSEDPNDPELGVVSALDPLDGHVRWVAHPGTQMAGLLGSGADGAMWVNVAGGPVALPVVGPDGNLYAGAADGRVYAVSPEGAVRWTLQTGDHVRFPPVVGPGGEIYAGSDDGFIRAIDDAGAERWRAPSASGATITSQPLIDAEGSAIVTCDDCQLYAVSPEGEVRWSFRTTGLIGGAVALGSDGTIYACADRLYALDRLGNVRWRVDVQTGATGGLLVGIGGMIYVSTHDGQLWALLPTGEVSWVITLGGPTVPLGAAAQASSGCMYVVTSPRDASPDMLHAIHPAGARLWELPLPTREHLPRPAVGGDGTVYVVGSGTHICAISPEGAVRWAYAVDRTHQDGPPDPMTELGIEAITAHPAVAGDGMVYIGGRIAVHAINAGILQWRYAPPNGAATVSICLDADGRVYIAARDGHLCCLSVRGELSWERQIGRLAADPSLGAGGMRLVSKADGTLHSIGGYDPGGGPV